jgi:hypothetical protein
VIRKAGKASSILNFLTAGRSTGQEEVGASLQVASRTISVARSINRADSVRQRGTDGMKLHFLLGGIAALALLISAPNSLANGGGGHGGGGGGHGGGNFHGGGFHGGGFRGRGGRFFHGRFFGPGFGYYGYGYGYPWWGWDYPYYPYYGYYGYDSYYGDQYNGDSDARFNSPRAVQAALAWRGYYSGRIDGVMGPETRSAIRSFQAQQGLPVTGQIDNRLIESLRR